MAPINAKRAYRLMKRHGLLLERHTRRRRVREHDGQVATIRSDSRWCSDAEFTCWGGEIVRVAFALDCHDREVIGWVATTAGISGEMIRDMMVRCVEQRFGAIRAPHPVQWLSDNGSIFAAHKTIEIAGALNLLPCCTPLERPESNGMAEASAAIPRQSNRSDNAARCDPSLDDAALPMRTPFRLPPISQKKAADGDISRVRN
jgi:putative transposase